jgi:hypothetical protein
VCNFTSGIWGKRFEEFELFEEFEEFCKPETLQTRNPSNPKLFEPETLNL